MPRVAKETFSSSHKSIWTWQMRSYKVFLSQFWQKEIVKFVIIWQITHSIGHNWCIIREKQLELIISTLYLINFIENQSNERKSLENFVLYVSKIAVSMSKFLKSNWNREIPFAKFDILTTEGKRK